MFSPSVAPQPISGRGHLIVEVRRSFTITHTHTHTVALLWPSDQPVPGAATYTTHNKFNIRRTIPSTGLETTISGVKRLQSY